jgi:hypothetical protein
MAKSKNVSIKYTSRDFNTIKSDLVDYAKRYYPDTYKDFTSSGFGSLTLDSVAYIGDILSFYLDYQANESFLDTALEYDNVVKLGKALGFKFATNPSSFGILSFYVSVPSSTTGVGVDSSYLPVLRKGSTFSNSGGSQFALLQDVDFTNPNNEVVVAGANSTTGSPATYAVKAQGIVYSGQVFRETIEVGDFEQFKKILIDDDNITEIVSVFDAEGNEYYEVEYLSQDVIYRELVNKDITTRNQAPSILKPFSVPRRFVVDSDTEGIFLQFGYGSENNLDKSEIVDPSNVVLKFHGRSHITDPTFDPFNLNQTDKFGIGPSSTTLTVFYRKNTSDTVNAAVGTVDTVSEAEFFFDDEDTLDADLLAAAKDSLECINEEPITGDVSIPTSDELKVLIANTFASQNRAVTAQDYKHLIHAMPPRFGRVKRARILRDSNSLKRNLNTYLISEDENGFLTTTNSAVKQNIKTWLLQKKMINDTIDILDAIVVNFGINFIIVGESNLNRFDVLDNAISALIEKFVTLKYDIGEPVFLADVYNTLNELEGVIDAVDVEIVAKTGAGYSSTSFNFEKLISADGRFIETPKNVIMELKYPDIDIKGVVR